MLLIKTQMQKKRGRKGAMVFLQECVDVEKVSRLGKRRVPDSFPGRS